MMPLRSETLRQIDKKNKNICTLVHVYIGFYRHETRKRMCDNNDVMGMFYYDYLDIFLSRLICPFGEPDFY